MIAALYNADEPWDWFSGAERIRMATRPSHDELRAAIAGRCREAGKDTSVAPAEIAKALAGEDWRSLLKPLKRAAVALAQDGEIEILRKGRAVDPGNLKGVYRLRLAPDRPKVR